LFTNIEGHTPILACLQYITFGDKVSDYIESFNGKIPGELLDREIFATLEEAKALINV